MIRMLRKIPSKKAIMNWRNTRPEIGNVRLLSWSAAAAPESQLGRRTFMNLSCGLARSGPLGSFFKPHSLFQ